METMISRQRRTHYVNFTETSVLEFNFPHEMTYFCKKVIIMEYYEPQYLGNSQNPDLISVMTDISKEAILYSFSVAINDCCDKHGFMSYKMVAVFEDMSLPVYQRLELLAEYRGVERARKVGAEMVQMLRDTDTDDDMFPENDIEYICGVCGIEYISPFD